VTTRRRVVDGFEEVVEEEVFDAVVVCSGHFSEPRIADIPGIDTWPGKEMHSHNYRDPQSFRDKVPSFITFPKLFLSCDEG
jgi:cation diffusion facilitator CzcD-associated flavoprotein CzcO